VCAPPDFGDWIEEVGIPFVPVGPEVHQTARSSPSAARALPSPEQRRQMVDGTVAAQFATLPATAEGCDGIVGTTALQIAARSVAEQRGTGYVYAGYCPTALPAPRATGPVDAGRGPGGRNGRQSHALGCGCTTL
jgi:vancomycin aglycone glucosyltransferase